MRRIASLSWKAIGRGNEEGLSAAIQPGRCCFQATNVLDIGAEGPLPRLENQSLDTFGWTGKRCFHGAVDAVAHPTAYASREGAAAEPLPVANALDSSGNADVQLHSTRAFPSRHRSANSNTQP